MVGAANKFNQPMVDVDMDTHKDIWEELELKEGIQNMLDNFFFDDLPHEEDIDIVEETKKTRERESEIKEKCNKNL